MSSVSEAVKWLERDYDYFELRSDDPEYGSQPFGLICTFTVDARTGELMGAGTMHMAPMFSLKRDDNEPAYVGYAADGEFSDSNVNSYASFYLDRSGLVFDD